MADNKAIIERFEHAFAQNDTSTIDELCDPALVDHNPQPGLPPTLEGFKAAIAGYKAAFPDLELVDMHAITDGDTAATGKRIQVEGMNFYRLADGRITEVWTQFDGVGMLHQLGVLPVPEAATPA